MTKRSRIELVGTNALLITEARALIRAAVNGWAGIPLSERFRAEDACQKVAQGLLGAGQDREAVTKLITEGEWS